MSTAGEAASLFGAPDSSGDLFGAVIAGNADTSSHPTGGDPFSGQQTASTDFFDTINTSHNDPSLGPDGVSSDATPTEYNQSWMGTDQQGGYSQYSQGYSTGYSQQTYSNGWETQQAQWSSYGQQQQYDSAVPQANNLGYPAANQHTYDPYAPPSSHSTTINASNPYTPPAPKQRSVTAPPPNAYNHHSAAYAEQYPPQPSFVATQAPYDPYAPLHPTSSQDTAPKRESYVSHSPQIHAKKPSVNASIPPAEVPPPLPSASAYRPKVMNAYDPPLPPPKQARRSHASPPQAQYPLQSSPFSLPSSGALSFPPPVPPPPRGRSAAGHYDPPPPPHQSVPSQLPQHPPPAHPHYGQIPPSQDRYAISQGPAQANFSRPADFADRSHWSTPPPRPVVESNPSQFSSPPAGYTQQHGVTNDLRPRSLSPEKAPSQSHRTSMLSHPPQPVVPEVDELPPANNGTLFEEDGVDPELSEVPGLTGYPSQVDLNNDPVFSTAAPDASNVDEIEGLPPVLSPSKVQYTSPSMVPPDPYKPLAASPPPSPPRQRSPERVRSPASSSGKSWSSPTKASALPPVRKGSGFSPSPFVPRDRSGSTRVVAQMSPYGSDVVQRTASPSSVSVRSLHTQDSTRVSQPPLANGEGYPSARNRSVSNSSTLSISSRDPYAPAQTVHRSSLSSLYEAPANQIQSTAGIDSSLSTTYESVSSSQIPTLLARPQHAPYAPSPSLLGTNDPLGRTSVRIPVISFGFGGKIVTCFHGLSTLSTGFDVALSSRQSTDVQIRTLCKVVPESALETSVARFPGPLFSDPGTPTTSLVRTGVTSQTKTKKARVIKYLEERANEISQGLGYLHQDSVEGKRAEAKHVLILLLKVMLEHDGRLSGSPEIDTAVRSALVPSLPSEDTSGERLKTAGSLGFSRSGDIVDVSASSFPGLNAAPDPNDPTIAVHTLRTSHLEKLQNLLIRGDRRAAFQYAADERLWAHAMVIASSIDKESWKEVVSEFVRTELVTPGAGASSLLSGANRPSPSTGHEALKVAYSLYAGHGPSSVQEFLPPKLLVHNVSALHVPASSSTTPMTPAFPQQAPPQRVPFEVLSKWADTAAMMVSSPMAPDTSSALTALGDQLNANGWYEAAHACYLLSPQTSPLGGIGAPAARVLLYGATNPTKVPSSWKDPDPIIFTEIAEFALSLATPTKGQEPFAGLPHLQAYRLIRAATLAEMGHDQLASRYCEAISASMTRPSVYINQTLTEELKSLHDRLIAAPHLDKSGSWIGSKITRPSLDKLGGWLGGQINNFIAGEADSPQADDARVKDRSFTGPFAHYSTISSSTSSAMPSPKVSTTDLTEVSPPYRSGSALALRPPAQVQINRASSAMDYIRRKPSPVQRVSSANAIPSPYSDPYAARSVPNGSSNVNATDFSPKPPPLPSTLRMGDTQGPENETLDTPQQGPLMGSWWGASDSSAPTPTAASFVHTDNGLPSADGFVSLMDNHAFSATPMAPPKPANSFLNPNSTQFNDVDEDDELGLGNSANRRTNAVQNGDAAGSAVKEASQVQPTPEPEKPAESKPAAAGGGWLSRWWKRSDTAPGPVKANLGEETSFYYDKELKRWVNKTAGAEAAAPKPPPPPPRAQTASPGTASARLHPGSSPGLTPPIRPATAIDLSDSPPRGPPRPRSNLVPSNAPASTPPPPPAAISRLPSSMDGPPGLDGPPTAAARAKAHSKRNVRSRYVDVFQQNGAN